MRLICVLFASLLLAPMARAETPADYKAKAEALVKSYADAGRFSGAVLVAVDGKPLIREGFGLADREWNAAVTPQTEFRLGSITKQFTATAILQLAEQGKLNLDDPISKYYAGAPSAWSGITLRHLLTHTSGIPSYTAIPGFFDQQARLDLTPEGIIALTRDKPLDFPPGAQYAYDNTGYILLGYVIEKVSGEPYAHYLTEHIFEPLGMAHTGYDVSAEILPERAAGYTLTPTGLKNAPYLSMTLPYAAGSLYSDVDDLLTWDQALYASKPMSAASTKAMFTDYGHNYGFGYGIAVRDGHREWSHGGGINGFATFIARYPDDHLTVIVLSNIQEADTGRIANQLADLYFGKTAPAVVMLAPAALDRFVGIYQLGPKFFAHIARDGDHLTLAGTHQPPAPLLASGERTFFSRIADIEITFEPAAAGGSPGLALKQNGTERPAKRVDPAEAARIEAAPAAEHVAVAVDPKLFDRYVGVYRLNAAISLNITRDAGHLYIQATGQPRLELFPQSETDFFLKPVDIQVSFKVGPDGKASAAIVHQNGLDAAAPRAP